MINLRKMRPEEFPDFKEYLVEDYGRGIAFVIWNKTD
jgi:hypothetical protein